MTDQLSLKILIVDSDVYFRTLCTRRLKRSRSASFSATSAANAASALSAIQKERFDCVLIDSDLPDLSAEQLVSDIQSQCDTPCPVILLWSGNRADARTLFENSAAADLLPKREVANYGLISTILSTINKSSYRRTAASNADLNPG